VAPVISLLHPTLRVKPSAGFPEGWRGACSDFYLKCDHPESVEYVIGIHESKWAEFWGAIESPKNSYAVTVIDSESPFGRPGLLDEMPPFGRVVVVKNEGRNCGADQLNTIAGVTSGKLIFGLMDDLFAPAHWDTKLLEAIEGPLNRCKSCGWPLALSSELGCVPGNCSQRGFARFRPAPPFPGLDSEVILICSSGASPERDRELMICGAWTRKRYERYGYILDPDFESMYADNWNGIQARRDEAAGLLTIIERLDIQFEHNHPALTGAPMDEVYSLENREEAYRRGSVVLQQKVSGSRVMVMCLPGENFRSELAASRFNLIDQTRARTRYGIVSPHWCHTTNVYATRIELTKAALSFPTITPDVDLVLTADDDNPLEFPQLEMLIADLEARPELAGVLAWCWCDHSEEKDGEAKNWVMSAGRQDPATLTCLRFSASDFDDAIARGDCLISSDDIRPHAFWSGLPVMLIRRSALEQLGWRAFVARTADPVLVDALKDAQSHLLALLGDCPTETAGKVKAALKWAETLDATQNGMTSEDTSFFIRAHELGLKFAVDIRVRVPHIKWRGITPQYVPEREREQVKALVR
jgi:hypothetical protein